MHCIWHIENMYQLSDIIYIKNILQISESSVKDTFKILKEYTFKRASEIS